MWLTVGIGSCGDTCRYPSYDQMFWDHHENGHLPHTCMRLSVDALIVQTT